MLQRSRGYCKIFKKNLSNLGAKRTETNHLFPTTSGLEKRQMVFGVLNASLHLQKDQKNYIFHSQGKYYECEYHNGAKYFSVGAFLFVRMFL